MGWLVVESRNDNLTKVIMEALMIDGFFHETTLPISPIYFGVDGINVFSSTKISVIKQIHDNYYLHSIGPITLI